MGNLIKPADYAAKMGISRQAVYAKIKKGILSSRNIGGKLFVVLDSKAEKADSVSAASGNRAKQQHPTGSDAHQEKLLAAKDETISILRETITDLKETNKMITSTLRGEVDLLKEAFSEMKMLYGLQLEHKVQTEEREASIEVESVDTVDTAQEKQEEWLELSDFYALHGITKKKKQKKIREKLRKRAKKGDPRVDRFNGEILFLASADFEDLLAKG